MSDETTRRTNIYLTEQDREMIAYIGERHGLKTSSSVIRFALRRLARILRAEDARRPRPPRTPATEE